MPEIVDNRESWPGSPLPTPEVESVVDRLARLEQSLASLQNSERLEQALTQRILHRLQQPGVAPDGLTPMVPPLSIAAGPATTPFSHALDHASGIWAKIPILAEFRLMFLMYFDPCYRLSRICQLGVPIILALVMINYAMFNLFFAIPLLGMMLERIGLVILAIALYKILAREVVRYTAVLDYLKRYGYSYSTAAGPHTYPNEMAAGSKLR